MSAGRSVVRHALAVVICLAVCLACLAPARPARAEQGDELTIYVLTFGPGDHPFFKFGHNAILVRPRTGPGAVFNYGTFAFETPGLITKFLRGRLVYWLSESPTEETLWLYQASNRTIEAQELDLTPAQRWNMFQRLMDNARPDKREYLYDYFWDNCSTRVRDVVDVVVGGKVREAGTAPGAMTLRAHALRLTADLLWEYVGLHFGLGSPTDVPIDRWQESFIPEKLRDLLRTVRIPRDGATIPLVKSERVLFAAQRPPIPDRPPSWLWVFLLIGVVVGAALAALGWVAPRRRVARGLVGLAASGIGLVLGLLGLCLVLLWAATNHRAAWANANIFQAAPWALLLFPLGAATTLGRAWARPVAFVVAAATAALSVVGLILKVLPGPAQDNYAFIALLLPIWLGLTFALGRISRA